MGYQKQLVLFAVGIALILAGLYTDTVSEVSSQSLAGKIAYKLTQEVKKIDEEAGLILSQDSGAWEKASHSFYLVDSSEVIRWNKNDFLPDLRTVQDDFDIRLLEWPRGIFLLKKWKVDDRQFLLAVLPLYNRYKITNRYLFSGWNKKIFPTQQISLSDQPGSGFPFVWEGRVIFTLQLNLIDGDDQGESPLVWVLLLAGICLLLIGAQGFVTYCGQRRAFGRSLLFLLLFFVGGRIVMLTFMPIPDIPLFDAAYFASSSFNRSIGDLFLNSLTLLIPISYFFYHYSRMSWVKGILRIQGWARNVLIVGLLLLCIFCVLFPYLYFETISHNSSISLDITQSLGFDWIRLLGFLSVVIGCLCGFMMVHGLLRLSLSLLGRKHVPFLLHLSVAVLVFFFIYQLLEKNYLITMTVAVGYLLVIVYMSLYRHLRRTSYSTFLYIFVAIIMFALQGAISIRKFVLEDKINSQFRFANSFLTDRDHLGEYLLNESVQRISADPFILTRLGSPFLSKTSVREKIKQVHLSSYFDRYDIQIHLFSPSGDSYDNSTEIPLTVLTQNIGLRATQTGYEGVLYLQTLTSESTKRYLVIIPATRFGMSVGYIVLDLSLKRVIPRNIFPELLLDDRFIQYFKNRDYSYATFAEGKVISSFGDYNFDRNFSASGLTNERLFKTGIHEGGYVHIAVLDEYGNTTVVSSPEYRGWNVFTNFAFLFTIGLNLVLLVLLGYGVYTWYQGSQLNYSARIQLYVYIAFILPLLLVSGTTLGLISRSAETQLREEFQEKSKVLGERITPLIENLLDDINTGSGELDNQFIELTRLANVDASLFTPKGRLLTSSQPVIYEDRIMPSIMNWSAYARITRQHDQSFVNNEQIGSLSYNSSYYALRSSDSGELIGILSLPFFESAYSLERTQISVVSNIIIIFCIVFILFSMVSYFAIKWLTFPLEFITRTLRKTTFTGSNKPLVWKSNDEIGLMVEEYNKMVENLERSKADLSRIQKESAWREIAKQVAHEVKNPLTPMKLTLQQMEKALHENTLSAEKAGRSIQTLLQQVEILNDIAASFSAFARMPAPTLRRIEIISLLRQVINLHSDYKEGKVEMDEMTDKVWVMGDDQLLSRVFSNIIINGLQSGEEGKQVTVRVGVKTTSTTCLISFTDNGKGIDADLAEKVFLPHFSTKKTGSGIGLAIAKQGIEQNGGTIRFETEKERGTTFYVEIPKV